MTIEEAMLELGRSAIMSYSAMLKRIVSRFC